MSKNIVLLSDGTGNSSSKLFKTNVWRMFQTLDLTDASQQVAYYDNGVGTSSFKLFAVLGGVFGFGLKRNVIDIYSFCSRNYVAGDRIYGFGFSRGAFTMRVVAGLIATAWAWCPIPATKSRSRDMRRMPTGNIGGASTARRGSADAAARSARSLHQAALCDAQAHSTTSATRSMSRKFDFLGVWDTVDAYGGPIEEIISAIDYWYWPLSMPDRFMNAKIHRACHALALEDERDAFKPGDLGRTICTRCQDGKLVSGMDGRLDAADVTEDCGQAERSTTERHEPGLVRRRSFRYRRRISAGRTVPTSRSTG